MKSKFTTAILEKASRQLPSSFLIGGFVFLMFDRGGAETPAFANNLNFGSFLLAYKLPLIALTLINTMVFTNSAKSMVLCPCIQKRSVGGALDPGPQKGSGLAQRKFSARRSDRLPLEYWLASKATKC